MMEVTISIVNIDDPVAFFTVAKGELDFAIYGLNIEDGLSYFPKTWIVVTFHENDNIVFSLYMSKTIEDEFLFLAPRKFKQKLKKFVEYASTHKQLLRLIDKVIFLKQEKDPFVLEVFREESNLQELDLLPTKDGLEKFKQKLKKIMLKEFTTYIN